VEPKEQVGANIRVHRKRLKLTQEALAELCEMHPVELGRAERGKRDLRVSTVAKIAQGLEIPAYELLRGI
jgi:transcriptional regulator with XRE-family HTH domain